MSINVGQQASDFLVCDWLMMLMMSSTNGGFERQKNRLVLLDEVQGFYYYYSLATAERVPVTEVMIDVSSLEAALKGEAP